VSKKREKTEKIAFHSQHHISSREPLMPIMPREGLTAQEERKWQTKSPKRKACW
jgi:hypothetical protein